MFKGVAREKELDDVINVHSRCEPGRLNKLIMITKFNKHEIRMLYQGFKQECPSGEVNEDTFKSIFSQFFPQGDASEYAHLVFKTFKKANGNKQLLNFEDFVVMLSQISRGSNEEKLQWIFKLYDSNGDGYISKSEMLQVVRAIYEMLGDCTVPLVQNSSAQEHVDRLFSQIDSDRDGLISFDDLRKWCESDPQRAQNLLMFDTVFM